MEGREGVEPGRLGRPGLRRGDRHARRPPPRERQGFAARRPRRGNHADCPLAGAHRRRQLRRGGGVRREGDVRPVRGLGELQVGPAGARPGDERRLARRLLEQEPGLGVPHRGAGVADRRGRRGRGQHVRRRRVPRAVEGRGAAVEAPPPGEGRRGHRPRAERGPRRGLRPVGEHRGQRDLLHRRRARRAQDEVARVHPERGRRDREGTAPARGLRALGQRGRRHLGGRRRVRGAALPRARRAQGRRDRDDERDGHPRGRSRSAPRPTPGCSSTRRRSRSRPPRSSTVGSGGCTRRTAAACA